MFKEKTIIITGAASGIGRALGEELARRGSRVVLTDIKVEQVNEVAGKIQKAGRDAKAFSLDVSDFDAVNNLVNEIAADYGHIDYMFNNAGIGVGGEVRDVSIEDWRNVIDINLYGVVYGVHSVYPIMVKQGGGHIVNTASIEGLVPFPGTVSYAASKFGVVGLSTSLRLEGKELGVNVSVVCPGYIKTSIFGDAKMVNLDCEKVLQHIAKMPGITPDECANAILRGVERNQAIIVVTKMAKFMYLLQRFSPKLMRWFQRMASKPLKEARIVD
jgi:NAD(P)-dependent dehydrogenase (short-subunit alcohol dehydrogenase family)